MKLNELVAAVKAASPKALGNLDEKRVVRVAQVVLREVARQVSTLSEGNLDVAGLGRFIVKQREVEKDGAKVKVKRVLFRPARAKAGGAKKGGGARKRAGKNKAAKA
jgi:hypothetical protein